MESMKCRRAPSPKETTFGDNCGCCHHSSAERLSLSHAKSKFLLAKWLLAGSALTFHLHTPDFASPPGVFVTAPLLVGFGNDGWNWKMAPSSIYRDKCQIGRAHVLTVVEKIILHPGLHSYLHRGAVHTIDRRPQNYQVADVNRNLEVEMIDGSSDHVIARMPVRGQ